MSMQSRAQFEATSRAGASWYPVDDRRLVARVAGGIKMVVDPLDFSLTPHLVMDGFWESWISLWFMRNVCDADRLLNIGANCGYYTLLAAKLGAHVAAVEPQPDLAENIRLSAALNGFSQRVRVEECVGGVEYREVTLKQHRYFSGSACVESGRDESSADWTDLKTREVPAHKLMPRATCVFVDAEGYEPMIWDGLAPLLQTKQLSWIALEWAPSRYEDAPGFLRKLHTYGSLSNVMPDGSERLADDAVLLNGTELDTLVVRRGRF